MAPYPKELGIRVVVAVEQGEMTIGEVAAVFSVGMTFVKKMLRLQRAGEDLAPFRGRVFMQPEASHEFLSGCYLEQLGATAPGRSGLGGDDVD